MDPLDDFDSLLKGAAGQYDNPPLTAQSVSTMIDERLAESKMKLTAEFRNEIRIIAICLGWAILFLVLNILWRGNNTKLNASTGDMFKALNIVYTGILVYLMICLFMFIRLMQVSRSQKDIHIREYVTSIYRKTKNVLQMYLWISTATAVFMAATFSVSIQGVNWFNVILISLVFGAILHAANIWYIRSRFRKRLDEMKSLMTAFN